MTTAPTTSAAPSTDSHWHPPPHSVRVSLVIVLVGFAGLCCVLAAWHIWPFVSAVEHTEDAYVRGNTTVVSPQVSGYVTQVLVRDFDHVRAGQVLVTIDDRTTWTKPWTLKQEYVRQGDQFNRIYKEPRCHEGNFGMIGLLAGVRAQEAAFAEGRGGLQVRQDGQPHRRGGGLGGPGDVDV